MLQVRRRPTPAAWVTFGLVAGFACGFRIVQGAPVDAAPTRAQGAVAEASGGDMAELLDQGQMIFGRDCSECHNPEGTGQGPSFEANAHLGDKARVIGSILRGSPNGAMAPFETLSDREVAAVATFIRNAMGNTYGLVFDADVKTVREGLKK
jgi:mono/diheme cytochrome c family protein